MTMSGRYRTLREKKSTISHLLNGRQSKELRCNLKTKMKNSQQSKNIADAFWDVIHSKPPLLPNIKMSSILNVETDMQRKTRLGHTQLLQETLPNERKVCCPDFINVNSLPSRVKDGKQGEGEHESLPASNNSQGFIFNEYQKENHELVKTDEEQKQPGSINIEVKLQIHFPQTILDSASCPIFDQFQFGKPERYARFPPPKSGEAKTDELYSARECVVPSDANHQKEQTGSIEKKEIVTFGVCTSAFSTSKRKRNVRQYSDLKTLVKPKCGIFKAKKPSISYMLNIKGGASTKHRKKLGCNLTTNMKEVDQDKKMAGKIYSFVTITPDINMYSKTEKVMLGDKRLSSKQVKQAIPLHKGNVTSDDTKETNLQGKEKEERQQEALLKVLQHGKCFIFCSGKREELQLHKSENEGSGEILFVTEQDILQQMQPIDPMQVKEPKKNHQTQNGTIYRANSKLPFLKSKESLRGQVLIDTMECSIPNNGSHLGELHNHGKEEKPEFNKNQQATILESLDVSIHNPSESKRQRRTFTCTALKSKMNSKCVIMKAKKTPISQIFNILGNGCLKNVPSRLLKSRISDFFIHINNSELPEDLTVEQKEGLAQELPAMMLEPLDISTLALLTSKRKHLKCTGKRNKMSPKCITLKAKNAPISQTFNITKRGTSSHRRQFKCNFKVMMEKCIPVADIILNDISSATPISLDMNVKNRIKVEIDEPQKMRLDHELQQEEQSPYGERAWCASSSDKRGSATLSMKKVKDQGEEALPWNTQHFSFNAHKMKEPHVVYSDLELKNSAREKIPESFTTTQELQQQALFKQHILHSISHSILNLRPFEKLQKRTKTKTELKGTRSTNMLSSMPGKSINESSIDIAQSGILFEKSPGKELASFIREREIRLQKNLPATALEYSSFPMPASSDFKGQRIMAHIPKSRLGKAQIVLKTINITRSGVLSHGKQQDRMLENMAKEISLGMSDMFINAFLSSTPASPAIKRHHKVKTKKGPLRQKSSITRGWEQREGKRLCTYSCKKWSTSKNTLESRGQKEKNTEDNDILFKAVLPFLNRKGPRKDQNVFIAEQEVQQQTLVSENITESVCSPLVIPFQTEELQKNIPPQKDILQSISEKISCPRAGKAMSDDLLINETKYSMTSDGNPIRKLGAQSAVSQQYKEEKEDGAQKEIKYTVDQNSPLTKSENSFLGDPYDERSRRNMGGHIAKECEALKRDLLTRSMTSVLSESKRKNEVFKVPERKNLTSLISVDIKTKKPLCSEMLTATEHGKLDCRKEQECHLRSTVKDKQQHKSIANPFSSPTPFSTDNKTRSKMHCTLIAETDQQRVELHNPTYFKLETSPCYRETEKTNTTDTQNGSSYSMKMNVQENKKEVGVGTINLMLPKHQDKKTQGSKDEPGVLLTQASDSLPSLCLLKLDKEVQRISLDKEVQRISNASKITHTEPVGGDMKKVENKKQHIPQKEQRGRETTVAMRGLTHTTDVSVTSKKSPPSNTLHRTELRVNIGSQGQRIHEGQEKPPGTVLRKAHICTSPTNLKLDKGTQVDVQELGIKRTTLFLQTVSTLSDAEKIEDTETIGGDVRKRTQHLSQKEKDRGQHRAKVDKEITGFSPPQLQLSESSGAGNIKYADSHEGSSSCTTIIKASEHMPYKDTRNRVKIEEGKGGILPQSITLRVERSPLTHLLSRKTLSLNIKEQVKDVQKDKGKPEMVLRKACASLPSLSHLELKTRMNEKEVTLGTKQSCFSPLKIQNSSNSGKKPYINLFEGFVLKKEDRLKIDVEDKMLPIYMNLKAKHWPLRTSSCKKWSTSKNPLESRLQNEKNIENNEILFKAGLFRKGPRKDQNVLIAEQEAQRQSLVSENIPESVCSPLVIPFQTEELQKNIPPQKDILRSMSEKISCPRAGKAMSDDLLINKRKYSMTSDGSPIRKLGAQSAVSLQSKKEKEDRGAKEKNKYTADQNMSFTKSENSLLGDPYDESSRRNVGGHIAKECEALKRDLLTRSMTSVLSEPKRKNEVFKLPERKNLTSLISVDIKTKKPLCSEMLTATEHGNLDYRKEQECHLTSVVEDKQQHNTIANPFSSPTPFSIHKKTGTEMLCTLMAETDQQRVELHNPTYFKLETSPCYRETEKTNTTDTQNGSSSSMKMNVQENKEVVGVGTINLMFPKHQEKKTQGSKDEPGVLLIQASDSLPSLCLLKLDKEIQRISNASKITHTESINGDMKNVENKKQHISQKEQRGRETTVAMRGLTHTTDVSVTSKKPPPANTLHRTELHVNIGSQGQRIHEGQEKPPGTVLRKAHICTSPTNLKLDKGTQVDVQELGIKRTTLFLQTVSTLSDAEKIEDTETIGGDVRKRTQHLSQKEKDRDQHTAKVDKEMTGFSPPQLQLSESSGAGNIKYTDSHEGSSSCTTIIKASEHMSYKDTGNRVKIEEGNGGILPQSITLRVERSPLTHLLSRKTLSLNIKEQVKDVQKDKGKPEMVLRKACASLPSPSHLKLKTRMNEKEVTLGTKQSCFSPLKIQNSSNSGKKPYINLFEGFVLKKEDRLKIDVEDKMLPIYMNLKAKHWPLRTSSCKKWSTSKNPLESRLQNEKNIENNEILFKAGLFRKGPRKDQNVLIAEQEAQRQSLVSENIPESVCSPLVIPFQTEELQKNIPPQKDILQSISEKISCPRAGKAMSDDLLINKRKYSMTSDGSPIRKLSAQSAVSLQSKKEKEDRGAKEKNKYTADQNMSFTKSENSLLGDPYDESSRRNVGGHIAKECEALKRDLLTRSMTSVLSEPKRKNEVFKLPERKNLTSLISVDIKTKKPLCSEMLTATEHGKLDCRKEQECHLTSVVEDKQQCKSIANPFSSPTPFSTDNKTGSEMYCTLIAETDQQRVELHNPTYFKLETSPCYRETEKTNTTDTQNGSSYSMKMNVQENKEVVGVGTINLMFPKHQDKKTQGSKDEPGVLLTQASDSLPSLCLLKLDKEVQRISLDKEVQRISNASKITHTEPVGGDMKKVENKKQHIPQKEQRGRETTVAMRCLTHTTDVSVTSKKSPPANTLHRTELHVNIGSQGQRIHEGQEKPPGTVLRKAHICTSPTNLKLDKGTQVDVQELGIKRTTLFLQMVSTLSDAEKIEDTETIGGDVRKRTQHLSQKEKDRDQHTAKVDKEITGFSPPQLQLSESSGAGNFKYADSHEGSSSCTTIIKASEHMSYKDTRNRVKIEGKGRILPQSITLRAERSPLTHLLTRKTLSSNIKKQVKDVRKDKGKPEMVLRKACASLPSPSHLKWETGMNEKEVTLRTTQSCLLPLMIQDSSISGKKAYTNSSEGYMLKGENGLKIDVEDKMLPIYMDLKAKKSPLPHTLNSKELQCKIKAQKRKVQEDKNKLVTKIKNICTSLLTVSDLKADTTEGAGHLITITKEPVLQLQCTESSDAVDIAHAKSIDGELSNAVKELKEHMLQEEEKNSEKNMDMKSIVEPNDMYLNTNKPPILLIYNLSDLQGKIKEQEGKVQKVTCDPAGVMLTKTCTSSSSPLQLNMNIRIREKRMPTLTRSPVSLVNFQESSDSEKVIYVEPIIPDILIKPQEGKQHMPQNKEEVGVGMANQMFPIHQEKKMQERKDERKVKMQEREEYDFNKPEKIALRNEVDSGTRVRSLSISVMDLSQAGEMVESDTNLEKQKKSCFSKFQKKSPNAGEIFKRNNSSTVKSGGQNITNIVPEDSKSFTECHQQMQQLSNVKSEEHLYSEINKTNLTPQPEERVVPGHDISKIIKEPDLLIIEQEGKAPKPILTPTEYPSMSGDPKENVETHMKHTLSMNISTPGVEEPQQETQPTDTMESAPPPGHRDQCEPIQDTTTQKVQQQKPFSETVPVPLQVESKEIQIVADSTSKESLLPLYDTIKNAFGSQIKNMIQDKAHVDKLEKVQAHYPDDWKSPPFAEGPEVTSTTIHPKFQPKPMLESKALEIKLNLIPKMEKQPFQKFDFFSKQTISKDNSKRFYPRHKKMSFLSLEGIDTIKLNLKQKYQKDSPQISYTKTLTVNVSGGSEEIITQLKTVSKLESGTSSATSANKTPLFQILQNYSTEEKDKLLIHFSMKTLEIQMKAFPRTVRESHAKADTRARRKLLSKCIHSSVKVPKQENTISLGFEEKSLHQIELDLQRKYLSFLLGLPVESMFPEPNILPKHIFKLNTAMCKTVDNSGESDCLSVHTDLLEQHTSFKEQSPHENSSLIRRFLEPTRVCASDPKQHGTESHVLKPHVTPETNKHHVWFQETGLHASFNLKIQENTPNLVGCHSIQISQDFTDGQIDIKSSANLEKCSALEDHESEESLFLEVNPYLSQESENVLFELQKGIPLENLHKVKQIKSDLNPLYSDNSGFHHIRSCRKSSSVVTLPSYESHKSRKYRSSSKVQSPDWLCHSSRNTEGVPFASSIEFSEEKISWPIKNRARYSLAPLTESNVKLHLAKSQDKPHRHPEGKKAKFDLFRNNVHGDCYPSYTQRKAKHTREKKVCDFESVAADYFLSTYTPASKPQEDINLYYERKQNQPFFYACVPADALEIIPQTIRWTIPKKTLRKRNFRVPLVAKISRSFHMWSLSRKLGDHS